MLRLAGLLVVLVAGLLASGCSVDRVEWESSGFPVEEVRQSLEEEHGAEGATVQCIQREVQGGEWECRAQADGIDYHCHATTNTPRKRIDELECEAAHEDESGGGEAPAGEDGSAGTEPGTQPGTETGTSTAEAAATGESEPAEH